MSVPSGTPTPYQGPAFTPPPAAAPPVRKGRGPAILGIIGAVVLVVSIVGAGIGFATSAPDMSLVPLSTDSATSADLKAATEYAIYTESHGRGDFPPLSFPTCTVVSPSGERIIAEASNVNITINNYSESLHFTSEEAGNYSITCEPDVDSRSLLALGERTSVAGIGITVLSLIGGVFGSISGIAMLIAGLVWKLVRSSRNKSARPGSSTM